MNTNAAEAPNGDSRAFALGYRSALRAHSKPSVAPARRRRAWPSHWSTRVTEKMASARAAVEENALAAAEMVPVAATASQNAASAREAALSAQQQHRTGSRSIAASRARVSESNSHSWRNWIGLRSDNQAAAAVAVIDGFVSSVRSLPATQSTLRYRSHLLGTMSLRDGGDDSRNINGFRSFCGRR